MVTLAGTQKNEKDLIEALLKLEYNALQAYDETIQRLEDPEYTAQIREFRADHLQHVEALTAIGREIKAEIPHGPGGKSLMTKGKVMIADMVGDDATILNAMKTNEYETVMAYENALEKDFLNVDLRTQCEKSLADERRHRDWMDQTAKLIKDQAA